MSSGDKACLAVLGLVGWHVQGRSKLGTFSRDADAPPKGCLAIDMSEVYRQADDAFSLVWRRPNLNLALPDGNVRNLFEGSLKQERTMQEVTWSQEDEDMFQAELESAGVLDWPELDENPQPAGEPHE